MKGRLDINLNLFLGVRSVAKNYIFLWLSLQEAFQYIAGLTCEFYFESVYVLIDATVLCLGEDNEDRALSAYKHEWHERGHSSLEVTMSGLVRNPEYLSLELVRTV